MLQDAEYTCNSLECYLGANPLLYDQIVAYNEFPAWLKEQLSIFCKEMGQPIFILIDELDRAKPDYAVSLS